MSNPRILLAVILTTAFAAPAIAQEPRPEGAQPGASDPMKKHGKWHRGQDDRAGTSDTRGSSPGSTRSDGTSSQGSTRSDGSRGNGTTGSDTGSAGSMGQDRSGSRNTTPGSTGSPGGGSQSGDSSGNTQRTR